MSDISKTNNKNIKLNLACLGALGCLHVEHGLAVSPFFVTLCCLCQCFSVLRVPSLVCLVCLDSGPYFSTSMAKYFSIFQHIWLATAKRCSYFAKLSTYILPPQRGGGGRRARRVAGALRLPAVATAACAFLAMMLQLRQQKQQQQQRLQREQTQTANKTLQVRSCQGHAHAHAHAHATAAD